PQMKSPEKKKQRKSTAQ
ncbi:hypothetical protein NL108_009008, partial [Boleophthalmus pectinirostris]